jgi:FtsH-binding integral membrane protein
VGKARESRIKVNGSLGVLCVFFCTVTALAHAQSAETPVVVLIDATLRLACLSGALLGALITIGLSKEGDTLRALTLKALTAVVTGIAFTPLLLRYFEYTPDVDVVLGASAALASMSTVTLQTVISRWDKWVNKKLDQIEE